ncbi:MAG: tRNA (adenosine(37)-N6)-dimethylallyltransferase MiaA [Phycisphaerae bacterium]|nr:tRNA (adenosine(37)-N6)-dimethylallyltransferase MiaA [Phycisphaerae bacterium]
MKKRILILGVTASGKATLGFELAQQIQAEIISVDSMKIYKRMDIGTAKPSLERQQAIPYHMIDLVEPSDDSYNVGRYYDEAYQAVHAIQAKNKPVIAVGGTALYVKAMLYGLFDGPGADETVRAELIEQVQVDGLPALHHALTLIDPEAAQKISANDQRRIVRALEVYRVTGKPISSFQTQFDASSPRHDWIVLGLRRAKDMESRRINARVKKMVEAGLIDEIRSLLAEESPLSQQARAAIGYAEIIDHLHGLLTQDEAIERMKINTRRLAKAQRTWFKTFRQVKWIDIQEQDTVESVTNKARELIESNEN